MRFVPGRLLSRIGASLASYPLEFLALKALETEANLSGNIGLAADANQLQGIAVAKSRELQFEGDLAADPDSNARRRPVPRCDVR